jgi:hypothetical protein
LAAFTGFPGDRKSIRHHDEWKLLCLAYARHALEVSRLELSTQKNSVTWS